MSSFIQTSLLLSLLLIGCRGSQESSSTNGSNQNIPAENDQYKTGILIGERAPEISMAGVNENEKRLSALRGKMVLVDFWASWCAPCRVTSPALTRIYNKYQMAIFENGNGFAIFSISLDKDRTKWLDAIEKDQLRWETHVSELKGWDSKAATDYKIFKIPAYFLLDGEGLIVNKGMGISELDAILSGYLKEN